VWASSNKILIFWQGVNHRPELNNASSSTRKSLQLIFACRREKPRPETEETGRGCGRDRSFSGFTIVLGRWESRGSALDQPRVCAHPEPLNYPILISRTVRRTYPTYMPSFHMSACPARHIFGKVMDKSRIRNAVVSVIWRFVNVDQPRNITYN